MISKSLRSKFIECLRVIFIIVQIVAFTAIGAILLKEANLRLRPNEVISAREGIVSEKTRTEGYTYYKTSYVNKVPITMPHIVTALYKIKLTIEENSDKTEKTIYVSKEEYDSYKIGDTYKSK